jgi:hypothetical protein
MKKEKKKYCVHVQVLSVCGRMQNKLPKFRTKKYADKAAVAARSYLRDLDVFTDEDGDISCY